jgi:hypothetical protein
MLCTFLIDNSISLYSNPTFALSFPKKDRYLNFYVLIPFSDVKYASIHMHV